MKKKIKILLFALVAMFILVGWGKKEVRLLDSSKLIDLNKAIELAKPGGNAGDSEEEVDNPSDSSASDEEETSEAENHAVHDSIDETPKNIVIIIRGKKISYSCGSVTRDSISDRQLERIIRLDFVSGTQVTLMDDFAEAHVYMTVREVLDKLKNDIGLSYKEDIFKGGE